MNDEESKNSELKQPEIEANNIVFTINYSKQPEEVIRISPEGFFWKGKLVQDDKEIYLRFKEWLDNAHLMGVRKPEPQKFNSIEERDNLIGLLQEALKFYANQENYKGNRNTSACYSGVSASLVEMDEGTQARFALEKAKQLTEQNQKIQNDYDKLMAEGLSTWGEVTNLEDIEQMIRDNKTKSGIQYTEEEQQHLNKMKENLKNSSLNDKNIW